MGVSWLKKGADAQSAMKSEEAQKAAAQAAKSKMWGFYLKNGESAEITFVDGDLNSDGTLNALMYREHRIFANGSWNNTYVCVADEGPCPLCEGGDTPSLVAVLTVIDHRVVPSKKEAGKTYTNTPKLFVMKMGTYKLLQKYASKMGGLSGVRFEVSRTGDKEPAVGDVFIPGEKGNPEVLAKQYTRTYEKDGKQITESVFKAADYEKELPYHSADDLRQMGFGNAVLNHSGGGSTLPTGAGPTAEDMSKHL